MHYKIKATRTEAYVGSTNNPYTDEYVKALKAQVRKNNKAMRKEARRTGVFNFYGRSLQRVNIKPRGPREKNARHTQIKDARYFDIYLHKDTTGNWRMYKELNS